MSQSNLDGQQILQRSFDESSNRIKVDAELTSTIIAPPGLEVAIEDTDDSIKIGNGSGVYVQVTGANALVIDGSAVVQPVSQSGVWTVQQGTPPWSVSQSGTWNINNISGIISLPTGASTLASQTTGNNSLSSIDSKLTTTNTNLSTIDSDLINFKNSNHTDLLQLDTDLISFKNANHIDLTTFTNANHTDLIQIDTDLLSFKSTNHVDLIQIDTDLLAFKTANHSDLLVVQGKQDTGNTSLASIDSKNPTLGQKTMSGSVPVTIASDQSVISTSQYYRYSEIRSRTFIYDNIQNTNGLIYTVTAGKTFYLTSIGVSALNSSATIAQLVIRDGATSAGDKLPYLWQAQPTLGTPQPFNITSSFENNPIAFTTDIRAIQVAGTIVSSVYIIGYEE